MPTDHLELAPAKLTRTLRVVGRRPDGLHLLESEMVSLDLADELHFSEGDDLVVDDQIAWSGPGGRAQAVSSGADNLVNKALSLVGRTAAVRLTKRIPAGAGLGGGSADAAAVFRWAKVRDLALAVGLGSDIPFCVSGGRANVSGVGERIEPLAFEPLRFVLLSPQLPISTAAVYATFDGVDRRDGAVNDLERAAIAVEPQLQWWRDLFYEIAALTPVLAGSGSTWFVQLPDAFDGEAVASELREAVANAGRQACITVCSTVPSIGDEIL